jgi:hypothetical protein
MCCFYLIFFLTQLAVWYQKGKKFFSKIITHLRYPSKRISHIDIILNSGNYLLMQSIRGFFKNTKKKTYKRISFSKKML